MYNVFDTEQEAIDAENADFLAWKATQNQDNASYWLITDHWDIPVQRLTDNKWVYKVCPQGSNSHPQEASQNDWFPNTPT
jgi:hypothetical protein